MPKNPLNAVIAQLEVSQPVRLCLIALSNHCDQGGGYGLRMTTESMSSATGLTREQVRKAMMKAWRKGYLSRDSHVFGTNPADVSVFQLYIKA